MRHRGISHASYKGCAEKALFPYRHPERSRGIFLAHRYSAVCVIAEKGKPLVKGERKSRVQGRFLAAPLMTVWGMGLFHVAYNGYVWKALFLYRHPERSGGIFLAHWYSAVCVIAENGNASRREQESVENGNPFCERRKKEQSARKISRLCSK